MSTRPTEPGSDESVTAAQAGLDRETAALRAAGTDVHGEVGDHDPVEAVRQALQHHHADEIILSTDVGRRAEWCT